MQYTDTKCTVVVPDSQNILSGLRGFGLAPIHSFGRTRDENLGERDRQHNFHKVTGVGWEELVVSWGGTGTTKTGNATHQVQGVGDQGLDVFELLWWRWLPFPVPVRC